ncbi:MAG: restriction endonuclease [Xanthomonadales bacterium]|nr:restriction endonuclease [Xanthomonadales bacterium]
MTLWMVRSASGGRLADEFVEKGLVALGAAQVGDLSQFPDKQALLEALKKERPDFKPGRRQAAASQWIRFRDEVQRGDRVVTYDSSRRVYHVGTIASDYQHQPGTIADFQHYRAVEWEGEVERDVLSARARNSLGSTLTLFRLPDDVAEEILRALAGQPAPEPEAADFDDAESEDEDALLEGYRARAMEIIKDRINRLDWRELEQLVAGVLRSMGYKTRISREGSDLGIDILASPDGFGFESPRIIVEVKHRSGTAIGSKEIRNLVGGRHASDKGLFVSTGGFTKDARYEADRANIPLMLWDLDDLVQALVENYENADQETRTLIPLTRLFWPV